MCTSLNYACRSWYFLGFVTLLLTASIWGGTDCSWFVNKILKSEFIFIMSHCLMSSTHFPIEIGLESTQVWCWLLTEMLNPSWVTAESAPLQQICVWLPASLSVSLKPAIKILLSVSSPTASKSCLTQRRFADKKDKQHVRFSLSQYCGWC